MKSMLENLASLWRETGCSLIKLPNGGGVVVSPLKGLMLEINEDGYWFLGYVLDAGISDSEVNIPQGCCEFLNEIYKILR